MFFVKKDSSGNIIAINSQKTKECNELIDEKILLQLTSLASSKDKTTLESISSDLSMIRVIEDLIEVLVDKSIINLTDLPGEVQKKMTERKKLRLKGALKKPGHGLIKI